MAEAPQQKLVEMIHEDGTVAYVRDRDQARAQAFAHDGHAYNVVRQKTGHFIATRSERRIDAPNGCGEHKEFATGPTRDRCVNAIIDKVAQGWDVPAWHRDWQRRQEERPAGWKARGEAEWQKHIGGRGQGRER